MKTINLTELLEESIGSYARYVILDRAIPDVRDGLKPGGRKTIYSMYEMGLAPTKPHKKSARVIGDTMGKYHPHGDAGLYTGLINLSTPWNNNVLLVDGHGNWGSLEEGGEASAAMRYTETRLSEIGHLATKDLAKNAVNFKLNFDGSETEPEVLPMPIPYALVNGTSGIAWSKSTEIAPHNIKELLTASIHIAKGKSKTPKAIAKLLPAPDSPTGCDLIVDPKEWEKSLETGKGRYVMRSTVDTVCDKKTAELVITSVPFNVKTGKLKASIASVLSENPALNAVDIIDETELEDVRIRIIFKPSTTEETLELAKNLLFKKTELQKAHTFSNEMISNGKPVILGAIPYLETFLEFRLQTLRNIWEHELNQLKDRVEVIDASLLTRDVTDEILTLARRSESKEQFELELVKRYQLTERQAKYIANTQIHQLSNRNFTALEKEKTSKLERIDELTTYLTDEKEANVQLIADLENTKSVFKQVKRKCAVHTPDEIEPIKEIKVEEIIESKPVKVVAKSDLQLMTIGRQAYQNQIGQYEDDNLVGAIDVTTTDFVFGVTKDGQYVTRFVNDLVRKGSLSENSDNLNKEIPQLKVSNEFVGLAYTNSDKEDNGYRLVILTKFGRLKVIEPSKLLPGVSTRAYVKKLRTCMKLEKGDEILQTYWMTPEEIAQSTVSVVMKDTSLKKGSKVKTIKLAKHAERLDGAGGSGLQGVRVLDSQTIQYFELVQNTTS